MKSISLMLFLFCVTISLFAQNSFPTSGNTGIGTTSPTESLEIIGNLRTNRIRTWNATFNSNSVSSFNSFNSGNDYTVNNGWIAADFGGSDNSTDRLVIGTGFGGKTVLATHNSNLTNWGGPLLIAPLGGNVGIGSIDPKYKLDVNGNSNSSGQGWFSYGNNAMSGYSWVNAALNTNSIEIVNNNSTLSNLSPTLAFHRHGTGGPQFRLAADGSNVLFLESAGENSARSPLPYGGGPNNYFARFHVDGSLTTSGNVGIGTSAPDSKLSVNGTIHSKEVKVDMNGWADYVFKKDYNLMPLYSLKAYIDRHEHLPEIPSEKEIVEKGLNVGEINKLLMKKVEELTLYLIQDNAFINGQEQRIQDLEARLNRLDMSINAHKN